MRGSPEPVLAELFFLTLPAGDGKARMMVADVRPGPALGIGRPRALFSFSYQQSRLACAPVRCYAVSPDGQRFYATEPLPAPPAPHVTRIQLIQGWTEELKARVPSGPAR